MGRISRGDCKQDAIDMYREAVEEEKSVGGLLFQEGSLIGLNAPILLRRYIASRRMRLSARAPDGPKPNKIHWMDHWISSRCPGRPTETEITSYIIAAIPPSRLPCREVIQACRHLRPVGCLPGGAVAAPRSPWPALPHPAQTFPARAPRTA